MCDCTFESLGPDSALLSESSIDAEKQENGFGDTSAARPDAGEWNTPGLRVRRGVADAARCRNDSLSGIPPSSAGELVDLERGKSPRQSLEDRDVPETSEDCQCWGLERTLIRRCPRDYDADVEDKAKGGGGDDDVYDGGVDRPHVPR